jgi:7-cyano-7-deazaguanine synthase
MNLDSILARLPETDKKVIITHSGGLDSSTAVILAVKKYGASNVISVGYDYGQKQVVELQRASELCSVLGVHREVLDLRILGNIVRGVSANITGTDIAMPTIKDVLGDPQPPSYIPHRNMILFSITAAFAEANNAQYVICGIQATDAYGYWDTTPTFASKMNEVFSLNRSNPITLIAPFNDLTKTQELQLLKESGDLNLLTHTLSCYNPNENGESCGRCPTCAERIKSWMDIGERDPVSYSVEIPWRVA